MKKDKTLLLAEINRWILVKDNLLCFDWLLPEKLFKKVSTYVLYQERSIELAYKVFSRTGEKWSFLPLIRKESFLESWQEYKGFYLIKIWPLF